MGYAVGQCTFTLSEVKAGIQHGNITSADLSSEHVNDTTSKKKKKKKQEEKSIELCEDVAISPCYHLDLNPLPLSPPLGGVSTLSFAFLSSCWFV